jgi:hypothetical protein
MRNIYDVIRQKESQIQQLERELEALRLAARLLTDDTKVDVDSPRPERVAAVAAPTISAPTMSPSFSMAASPAMKADTEVIMSAPLRQFP